MIKSIQISNFQSHESSTLEFSTGVNIIVGSSDSGKTAILRALRWGIWNRPSGDALRSWWGGETKVRLETEEGYVIRSKDKSDQYILGNAEGEQTFKAFGTGVPEEITSFLNVNEINLQRQLDQPFLLSLSPGQVAEYFNKIAKLDKIDTSTQNINSTIRQLNSDLKFMEGKLPTAEEELKKYDFLEAFEEEVIVLEGMEIERTMLGTAVSKVHAVTSAYRLTEANVKEKSAILALEQPLAKIFEMKDDKAVKEQAKTKLESLIGNVMDISDRIAFHSRHISQEKIVNEVLALIAEKKQVVKDYDNLFTVLDKVREKKEEIASQGRLLKLEQPISDVLQLFLDKDRAVEGVRMLFLTLSTVKGISDRIVKGEAFISLKNAEFEKEMGSQCVLCGSKLNHKH